MDRTIHTLLAPLPLPHGCNVWLTRVGLVAVVKAECRAVLGATAHMAFPVLAVGVDLQGVLFCYPPYCTCLWGSHMHPCAARKLGTCPEKWALAHAIVWALRVGQAPRARISTLVLPMEATAKQAPWDFISRPAQAGMPLALLSPT